ncbi:hypothetical protein [Amycolatopsis sp. NBC_00438]|uniref:hypothetical protein n=1 Tax=Amycolatopsis sp. NBC_00438 TaxID=2903558 RepID=UPI002E234D21
MSTVDVGATLRVVTSPGPAEHGEVLGRVRRPDPDPRQQSGDGVFPLAEHRSLPSRSHP